MAKAAKYARREWTSRFLLALRRRANIGEACAAAGISRESAYKLRAVDDEFRAKWDDAIEDAIDALETRAWARAMGRDQPDSMIKFLLGAHRPHKYRVPKNDVMVGTVIVLRPRDGVERRLTSLDDLNNLTSDELEMLAGDVEVEEGDYRLLESGGGDA